MNLFFGIGKILVDIDYGFLIDSKSFSAANTLLEVCQYYNSTNTTTVKIKGYDYIADRMYQNLSKNSNIFLKGRLLNDGVIEVLDFKILKV